MAFNTQNFHDHRPYNASKYTDSDNESVGEIYNSNGVADDSGTGVQIGITHNF